MFVGTHAEYDKIKDDNKRNMETIKTKIENETQYNWAMARIDELLPKVNDNTPDDDPNSIELYLISALVEEYEDDHYPIRSQKTDLYS